MSYSRLKKASVVLGKRRKQCMAGTNRPQYALSLINILILIYNQTIFCDKLAPQPIIIRIVAVTTLVKKSGLGSSEILFLLFGLHAHLEGFRRP